MEYNILFIFVMLLWIIVVVGFLNKKFLKFPNEIVLLCSSIFLGSVFLIIEKVFEVSIFSDFLPLTLIDDFLVHGFLCFMLFAGACDLYLKRLLPNFKIILLLAIIGTLINAVVFGLLTYFVLTLLQVTTFSLMECFLFGCIIAPTDPIAAMSILKKVGLSKELAIIIEGESLFNDGVGLALFVVVSTSLQTGNTSINPTVFLTTLSLELFGAIIIAVVISYVSLYLFKRTQDCFMQVFISLLAVSTSYLLSQVLGYSGAIAAVVCGIIYATQIEKYQKKLETIQGQSLTIYHDFWGVIQDLLNSMLYILLGITFIHVYRYTFVNEKIILTVLATSIVARYVAVFISTFLSKKVPGNMSLFKFTNLITYAGLKGALSLALAITSVNVVDEVAFHSILIATFSIVIFSTIIQGLSVGKFYKRFYK